MPTIIDGKAIASTIKTEIATEVKSLLDHGRSSRGMRMQMTAIVSVQTGCSSSAPGASLLTR